MAAAIAYSMKAPPFVMYSTLAVGFAANALGAQGGPLAVFFVVVIAVFFGKLVSKRTPIDIIVTPFVTIVVGVLFAFLIAPPIGKGAVLLGDLVMKATALQPFWMGILVSALMGIILTLPISSAAICAGLGLVGLAGGACVAGCSAHMVGFAVASYRENGVQGLLSQGLGTSMLQVPNLVKNHPLAAPVVASIVNGPLATCLFKLQMNGAAINSGMGTSGLCGQIGLITGWAAPMCEENAALGVDFAAATASPALNWIGLVVCSFVIPALVSWLVSELMRKKGLIRKATTLSICNPNRHKTLLTPGASCSSEVSTARARIFKKGVELFNIRRFPAPCAPGIERIILGKAKSRLPSHSLTGEPGVFCTVRASVLPGKPLPRQKKTPWTGLLPYPGCADGGGMSACTLAKRSRRRTAQRRGSWANTQFICCAQQQKGVYHGYSGN